jgi:hypothetical protein
MSPSLHNRREGLKIEDSPSVKVAAYRLADLCQGFVPMTGEAVDLAD